MNTRSLSEDEIIWHYENNIKPKFFNKVLESENKTAVFLGGQPGAGKSYLKEVALNKMETKSAVIIDSDLIREQHPFHAVIAEKDIYDLDKDCYKWGAMLIRDSIKEGKNLVFDGTLGGNLEQTLKTMTDLSNNDYKIKASVLATNDVISKIGVTWRYEKQKQESGRGRMVDLSYHDKIYSRIPDNVLAIVKSDKLNEFHLYYRDNVSKKLELSNSYNQSMMRNNPSAIVDDINFERNRPLKPEEVNELHGWAVNTARLVENNKGNVGDFVNSLKSNDPNISTGLNEQIKIISNLNYQQLNKTSMSSETSHPEQKQKEETTINGYLGADATLKEVDTKNGKANVLTFSVATDTPYGPSWGNVQMWGKNIPTEQLKKGDEVTLSGYMKEYETKNGTQHEFVGEKLLSVVTKEQRAQQPKKERTLETIKGNLGQDPITKTVNDKQVAVFSVAIKQEGSDTPKWQQVQVWGEYMEKAKVNELKKGDFVEIKGFYGNEYKTKNDELKRDFLAGETNILKKVEKIEEKKSGGLKM